MTEQRGRLTGEKGTQAGPLGPLRLLQLGGGVWAPSATVRPHPLRPGSPRSARRWLQGVRARISRYFVGSQRLPPSWSPEGIKIPEGRTGALSPTLPGGSGTARPQPVTLECEKVQSQCIVTKPTLRNIPGSLINLTRAISEVTLVQPRGPAKLSLQAQVWTGRLGQGGDRVIATPKLLPGPGAQE